MNKLNKKRNGYQKQKKTLLVTKQEMVTKKKIYIWLIAKAKKQLRYAQR